MPHITEKSVTNYSNRVQSKLLKGPWSADEDSTLIHLVSKFNAEHTYKIGNVNRMYAIISDTMHRSISSCQRRYVELKNLGRA